MIAQFVDGDLPDELSARFEWRPGLQPWPSSNPIFVPRADAVPEPDPFGRGQRKRPHGHLLTRQLRHRPRGARPPVRTRPVPFARGKKPEIDVKFEKFEFLGPLSFIETLRQVIPLDGFSDPPEVSVTAEGIPAGFSMGLPNLSFGVFSLENLSLGAGFTVPFVGPPMSTWFRFCERENPSRLTVMMFGGGFFFGVTVDAKGLQVAEGAIEFGAAISVDFGVASGSVSAMAGLYFKIESDNVTLAGYFRLRGEVEALGVVSVTIELYLEMKYETGSGKCVGTATIKIDIDVTLFSTTISITCSKKFAGSGPDPTLAEMFEVTPRRRQPTGTCTAERSREGRTMILEKAIFTALPNGLDQHKRLRLSVHVAPRLTTDDGDPSPRELKEYPTFEAWPERLAGYGWKVEFDNGATAAATPDEGLRADLWPRLFPAETFVRPHAYTDHAKKTFHSFPVGEVLQFIESGPTPACPRKGRACPRSTARTR